MKARRDDHDVLNRVRRFWKSAGPGEAGPGGVPVLLDGKTARTPGSKPLVLPNREAAELVAQEWEDVGDHLNSALMPATRLAFTAIDRVSQNRQAVAGEIARYAGSDLLCYLAESPLALVEQQTEAWRPLLDWAEGELGLKFVTAAGIVHRQQSQSTLDRVTELTLRLDDFALAGLAWASSLFGSAILAIALAQGRLTGEAAFSLSRLDETFQTEHWGEDAEARDRAHVLKSEALLLERWFKALDKT